ncbi:tyrosine-type recombinase/integrase [Heyndrickxia sporothermodurans]|uniref:tyrosine-type recombinase/integrase n=1 Tax=Heyndrickxia sporothermodurans TaxID=46224 RepID=UPI002DBA5EBF|nr:tyrosine-type recombinase/integrase [Heyndrickxia sporothermodurans]MEB6549682.1 tyrosine-type recombinase/integrase [Heyndrickxia sporothermodurans]
MINPALSTKELGNTHNYMKIQLSSYESRYINENGNVQIVKTKDSYFLDNNTWEIEFLKSIPNFEVQLQNPTFNRKRIFFSFHNELINLEIKFFVHKKIFADEWTMSTFCVGQANNIQTLSRFFKEKYPNLNSLTELDVDKVNREWLFWLESQGIATQYVNKRDGYLIKSPLGKYLLNLLTEFNRLIDFRDEWEKDVWEAKNLHRIYGLYYNQAGSHTTMDFTKIRHPRFREVTKRYFKKRLLSNDLSWGSARNYMNDIPGFLDFIFSLESHWDDLTKLSRHHIEKYLDLLNNTIKQNYRIVNGRHHIIKAVTHIKVYLQGLQEIAPDLAPERDIRVLIFPEDKPKYKRRSDRINYIPDSVLEQLFENINFLHEEVQPIIWIAFKTGLRVSDALRLNHNSLVKLNSKYQIVTDISKTNVSDHSIPIDDDLANILAVLIDKSKKLSTEENNPNNYIFFRHRGVRKGRPYSNGWVSEELNKLAKERKIVDENGKIYHFRIHQFRHTYAVKMLNSGADILTVQELLAHASPEMTVRYAKLLDGTKRKVFEEAMKQGLFSFDYNGEMKQITPDEEVPSDLLEMLWRDHKLNAIDNPYGSCHARINGNCPYSEEPPCLTCNGGSPCKDLAIGFSELDKQKYELLIKTATKTIYILESRGRSKIAEKNKKNLERYQNILNTIQDGNVIFGRLDRMNRKKGLANG